MMTRIKMSDYSALIRGWDSFTSREKFRALYEYRQLHPYKQPVVKQSKPRKPKPKSAKFDFKAPSGYYRMNELIERLGRNRSTIKRYLSVGGVREYRLGVYVAYCEYDLLVARDRAEASRHMNRRSRGVKNGALYH